MNIVLRKVLPGVLVAFAALAAPCPTTAEGDLFVPPSKPAEPEPKPKAITKSAPAKSNAAPR